MTVRDDVIAVTGVSGGRLDASAEQATIEFTGAAGPVRVSLPLEDLTALLSVCIGLAGQSLPRGDAAEHATIPVGDWRVGVSELKALVLGLAPEAGGALAFHLTRAQARGVAAALLRGVELVDGGPSGEPRRH